MKRKHFLLFSAVVSGAFGIALVITPDSFTTALMAQGTSDAANTWARYFGTNLFAIGIINFFTFNASWSSAVRGVLIGNLLLHVLGLAIDWYSYSLHVLSIASAMAGTVIHIVFIFGFSYYAFRSSHEATATASA